MADHDVDICNDWNGSKGDKVTFENNSGNSCTITQNGTNSWPFKEGPPLPATGSIPPGGTLVVHLANHLADGSYSYMVNGCDNMTPKIVTVP
jgi:hypothetical protein